jgi:hypothetical protein
VENGNGVISPKGESSVNTIRDGMYRYEQIIEKACAAVETSCAPCEGFLSKAVSNLVPVDNGRLGPFKFSQARPQYCRRWSGLVAVVGGTVCCINCRY